MRFGITAGIFSVLLDRCLYPHLPTFATPHLTAQVEAEQRKNMAEKLKQVTADLKQLKADNVAAAAAAAQ